jgi:hypothetical protein
MRREIGYRVVWYTCPNIHGMEKALTPLFIRDFTHKYDVEIVRC